MTSTSRPPLRQERPATTTTTTGPARRGAKPLAAAVIAFAAALAALVALPAPAQAACGTRVTFHGYAGYKLCGTGSAFVRFNNGSERMFVIGTDSAVWNIDYYPDTAYVSGWKSMGGIARSWVRISTRVSDENWIDMYVIGADGRYWTRRYFYGDWLPWQRANWAPSTSCTCS